VFSGRKISKSKKAVTVLNAPLNVFKKIHLLIISMQRCRNNRTNRLFLPNVATWLQQICRGRPASSD